MRAWLEKTTRPSAEYHKMLAQYEKEKAVWDKAHANGIISGLDFPPVPPSRVSYNKYGISLHVYGKAGSYDIWPWDRISNLDDILWWVSHLCGKTWCDRRLVRDFVELARAYIREDIKAETEASE